MIAVLIFFSIPAINSSAGVEYEEIPGNSIVPVHQTDIRLLQETVVLENERVFASVILENTTEKENVIEVGFPFTGDTEPPEKIRPGKNFGERFSLKVDGKVTHFEKVNVPEALRKQIGAEYDFMYKWKITFGPSGKKKVEYSYNVRWGTGIMYPDGSRLTYKTKPSALWKGTIRKAIFRFKLSDEFSDLLKHRRITVEAKPEGYKIVNSQTVEWHFLNWKPSEDLSITIWEK
jgi:hypothetical protein